MEMVKTNSFVEMSNDDMRTVEGGVWPEAVAIITLLGATLAGSFNAGRTFVRDIRNKFFS